MHPETVKPGSRKASAAVIIRRYVRELKRRWWIVVAAVVLFACLGRFALPERGPEIAVFQAQMWVGGRIQLNDNKIFHEEVQSFYGTQMELMQSRTILRRAHANVQKQLPDAPETPVRLNVTLSPRAAIFNLTASGENPDYVKRFLDAVMDEYLDYKREMRAQKADLTVASISGELTRMDAEFNRAHDQLNAFLRTNSVAELDQQGSDTSGGLASLNSRLAELNYRFGNLSLIASNQNYELASLTTESQPASDLRLQALREIARLEAQREELAVNLKPKHPRMIQLETELRAQKELLKFAQEQSREALNQTLAAVALEIRNTETLIREQEKRMVDARSRIAEYERLTQNLARAERVHDYLLSTVRNVDLNKHLDQENIAVLERAEAIPVMAKLNVPRELLGGIAGMLTGLGVVFLLMISNDRVASAKELEGRLSVPVIGQVPALPGIRGRPSSLLIEAGDARHGFAESLKSVRSSLFYSTVNGSRPKTLLVTSALPDEGKSTVAANLARGFAFSGYRVLLVDADLRCSVLPALLDLPSEPGLSDVLQDGKAAADAIVPTGVPNLSFLPPGRKVVNPGELFLSSATDKLLGKVYDDFDYVVIDSVPVLAADDTTSLAPKVEGIVFVIRAAMTSTRLAQRALDLLQQRQGCVLGAVCNRGVNEIAEYDYGVFYPLERTPAAMSQLATVNGQIVRSE